MNKIWLLALAVAFGCKEKYPEPAHELPIPPRMAASLASGVITGQAVKTTAAAWIRSSPYHGNTSSNVIGTAPAGAVGTIMAGPVLDTSSDGDRWKRWDVAFSGTIPRGWVADTYLVATTPPPPPAPVVTTVTVSPATASLRVGATVQLAATARDQNGLVMTGQSFAWTSSATSIASVNGSGNVTGLAAGSATVRATDAGKVGQALVTVTVPPPPGVRGIAVSPVSATIRLGELRVLQFTATVFDTSGAVIVRSVTWSSANTLVATVDTGGWITPTGLGTTLVTATIGTVRASGSVTVVPRPPLPFNGIYAMIQLRNGRLQIVRRDSVGTPPIIVAAGDTMSAGFRVRPSTAPLYAAALRQLASDIASRTDTLRFQTTNALSVDSVFCAAVGCWVTTVVLGQGSWTSSPPVPASILVGLARALDAAVRGDSVFMLGDSLPYLRTLP